MQIVIDIDENLYTRLFDMSANTMRDMRAACSTIRNGTPLPEGVTDCVLDKIRAEIDKIEINGHIRDVECFRAGLNVALNIIDKYKEGKHEN